jgi:hypothetical protein
MGGPETMTKQRTSVALDAKHLTLLRTTEAKLQIRLGRTISSSKVIGALLAMVARGKIKIEDIAEELD